MKLIFDTGAFTVLLRAEDAAKAGIDVKSLKYTINTSTPNGVTQIAPVVFGAIRVGNIVKWNVSGAVSRPGESTMNLLGQTFISRLGTYKVDGDYLVLSAD